VYRHCDSVWDCCSRPQFGSWLRIEPAFLFAIAVLHRLRLLSGQCCDTPVGWDLWFRSEVLFWTTGPDCIYFRDYGLKPLHDTKFRRNIVVYFIIWTSFRLCTVKSLASAAVFVLKGDGKFCTSPEPKLPDQYGKRNRYLILTVDINISNCGYQQHELSISTNCIVDIDNSNCWYWTILMYCSVQYSMSVMDIICWYRQFELLISTMLFVDVDNWYSQYQHVRAIIPVVSIDNWNYRYLIIYVHCWYRQLMTISIVDMNNLWLQQF